MKILISAGPTREYIDPVRFISNPSTGKMGYLVAKECIKKGHEVLLVSGPTHLSPPKGAVLFKTETAKDMHKTILELFSEADALVMTAAISDWRPEKKCLKKLKRKESWALNLIPTQDILKDIAKVKRNCQLVIGFALETDRVIENAKKKLKEKKLDLIIADTPEFFGERKKSSKVFFIYKDGAVKKPEGQITKEKIALQIAELLEEMKCLKK